MLLSWSIHLSWWAPSVRAFGVPLQGRRGCSWSPVDKSCTRLRESPKGTLTRACTLSSTMLPIDLWSWHRGFRLASHTAGSELRRLGKMHLYSCCSAINQSSMLCYSLLHILPLSNSKWNVFSFLSYPIKIKTLLKMEITLSLLFHFSYFTPSSLIHKTTLHKIWTKTLLVFIAMMTFCT